jgi:hypothetical protein
MLVTSTTFAQFEPLLLALPSIFFYVSFPIRYALHKVQTKKISERLLSKGQDLLEVFKNATIGKQNIDVSDVVKEVLERLDSEKMINEISDPAQLIVKEDVNIRNSDFSFGSLMDALILSILNAVIIMFELGNLIFGTILLISGLIIYLFGILAVYVNNRGVSIFIILVFVLGLFPGELAYLLTLNGWAFWLSPLVIFLIVLIIALMYNRINKRKKILMDGNSGQN